MEGEVTSELDAPTDATVMEAVNESGAAKVVGRADDDRGDRRATQRHRERKAEGTDSDVAGSRRQRT